MLLESVEFASWQKKMPGRLADVLPMNNQEISAVLAWYQAKDDPHSARRQ
jgi:hypothetical protein